MGMFEFGLPPTEVKNLLKCNLSNRNIFDVKEFLKLYYFIENQSKE
jgi:hypothetical protein